MKTTATAAQELRALVPYTFEESLANWADALEWQANNAHAGETAVEGHEFEVVLSPFDAGEIATLLRGAARLLERETTR